MGDINLKEAFQKTNPTDSEYWTFSSDSHVQFEQLQGAQGSRAPIAISTTLGVAGLHDQEEKQKKKDEALHDLLSIMDEARRLFDEASQAAQRALDGLGQSIDKFKVELDDLREEFDRNTVSLSDGAKVYYNTETAKFEQQDERGDWHVLEGEDAIEEAFQKAAGQGGLVSTKQGKQALDERQESLDSGTLFILTQQDKLVDIDQAVEDETLSLEDATKQTEQITRETEERTHDLTNDWAGLEQAVAPVATQEQTNSKAAYEERDTEEWDKQAGSSGLEALFENSEDTPASQSSPIPSGPVR